MLDTSSEGSSREKDPGIYMQNTYIIDPIEGDDFKALLETGLNGDEENKLVPIANALAVRFKNIGAAGGTYRDLNLHFNYQIIVILNIFNNAFVGYYTFACKINSTCIVPCSNPR